MAVPVLLSGLPGKMAEEVARLVVTSSDFDLLEEVFTEPAQHGQRLTIEGQQIMLVGSDQRDALKFPEGTIGVDFTTPSAALGNIQWYVERGLSFVIGTTGYDADAARKLVATSSVSAVIAPNMAAPIVMLQAALDFLSNEYPGGCAGTTLTVRESHQAGKLDTSGTAKALVASFQQLGIDFKVDEITKIRDPEVQRAKLGVPEEHIAGHALHRYDLRAANDTVQIVLEHNVHGRRVYAEGTLLALSYLQRRVAEGSRGDVFSMHDVLRGR